MLSYPFITKFDLISLLTSCPLLPEPLLLWIILLYPWMMLRLCQKDPLMQSPIKAVHFSQMSTASQVYQSSPYYSTWDQIMTRIFCQECCLFLFYCCYFLLTKCIIAISLTSHFNGINKLKSNRVIQIQENGEIQGHYENQLYGKTSVSNRRLRGGPPQHRSKPSAEKFSFCDFSLQIERSCLETNKSEILHFSHQLLFGIEWSQILGLKF